MRRLSYLSVQSWVFLTIILGYSKDQTGLVIFSSKKQLEVLIILDPKLLQIGFWQCMKHEEGLKVKVAHKLVI